MNIKIKNKKIVIIGAIVLLLIVLCIILIVINSKNSDDTVDENVVENSQVNVPEEVVIDDKVDVIDINSKSRPYALVVNNTDVAVQVQEGLNKAYLVYEIPTEGYTSRLLALYKDINEDLVIGTIRSARHNFIDYALESDAILCCFGWSRFAQADLKTGIIDYMQGLFGYPFYRNNPENLATEHTAYTSMNKLVQFANQNGMRTTSDNSVVLNYYTDDVNLSNASNVKVANTVTIPYGAAPQIASFKYDANSKMYIRYENGNKCVDHNTKEDVSTKNIIAININYKMCSGNYYWDLETVGTGTGHYITNGYAVPITWTKERRSAKTIYKYAQGTTLNGEDVSGKEIFVSDGRTWIEIQTTKQTLTIE